MKKSYVLLLLMLSLSVFGQQSRVETSIDTTKNQIGAQFNLTLKTNVDTLSNVVFPSGTNFGPMEVIRSYVVDTVRKGDRYDLVKKYGLTQFDSGLYTIPAMRVVINNRTFQTDSIRVEVSNVAVDTLKQNMYDIKPITEVPSNALPEILKYVLILLLIIGIGVLIYIVIRRRQKRKADDLAYKTPIERATTLLQNLEKKELWQKGDVKAYYSELTDIARNYIEEAIHIPAMESTTSELIAGLRDASEMKKMTIAQDTLLNLEKVLKQADLVKFAKSKPLDFEIADDRSKIEKAIVTLDKSIPEVSEDDAAIKAAQHQKLIKKQKLMRILITVGVVFTLLFATTAYFIATKGFDYVKDNLLGHPTKELLEGEWVYSEYGNPAIGIETPKVLKRADASQFLTKDAMAMFKEFQMFAYGSLMDDFTVMVSTTTYVNEVDIDLSKAADGIVKGFELRGAQNILVKQEEYESAQGLAGVKMFGTLTAKSPLTGESKKLYYEVLVFGQQNGLQQIIVMHQDGDRYAKDVMQRILSSVDLKTMGQ